MCAYEGFTSVNSTSSTSGSFLVCLTNLRTIIGPGAVNQDGRDIPIDDRRWKTKNLSCGVELVDVERSDLIECNASGSTTSH